jgi:hypothetical protein
MARRRYISTEISFDKEVNRLAARVGDFAALFYTWGIPHAEEDATLHGDPEELLGRVMPLRRDKQPEDVEAALTALADAGLIFWNRPLELVQYPVDSFYKYQSNVVMEKRRSVNIDNNYRATAENSKEQQESAKNATSSSLSSSLSVTPSISVSAAKPRNKPDFTADFEEVWALYPHPPRDEKGRARKNYLTLRNKGVTKERLLNAVMNYAVERRGEERQYHKKAANFFGEHATWETFEESAPANTPTAPPIPTYNSTDALREQLAKLRGEV